MVSGRARGMAGKAGRAAVALGLAAAMSALAPVPGAAASPGPHRGHGDATPGAAAHRHPGKSHAHPQFPGIAGLTHKRAPKADDDLLVTFVARTCEEYSQVMANKARNNLQESLRDLGPDSNYASSEAVSAAKEQAGTSVPPCKPLPDWTFSTGTGHTGRQPSTQNLSTVTGPIRGDITTHASTPELDDQGNDTGRTLHGAVTVRLNERELAALASGSLWVQGGTPSEPLNGKQEQYGFAALRCAQDAVNGDNVEYVTYPAATRHTFCYYYAVSPPPDSGAIKVVKKIAPDSTGGGTFRFDGNISYADTNNDGVNDFTLSAAPGDPGEETFIRAESTLDGNPWTFQEVSPPGWRPEGEPSCTSANGKSRTRVNAEGKTDVGLSAGDTVTCTYTNTNAESPSPTPTPTSPTPTPTSPTPTPTSPAPTPTHTSPGPNPTHPTPPNPGGNGPNANGELPFTGQNTALLLTSLGALIALLVGAGILLRTAARRRNQ